MSLTGKAVLITGANRGIGKALVEEALRRNAARVYAGARSPLTHPDPRVIPLSLDITDAEQIVEAAATVESLDVLVNNAGIARYDDLTDRAVIEAHLAVNLYGTFDLIQAVLPQLVATGGAVVNNLSLNALAPLPVIPAYSISKAAAFNMTQSLRVLLGPRGVRVHAVLTGPVDTDMTAGFDIPKTSPGAVAHAIFDGVQQGAEEIFPDPISRSAALNWPTGTAKTLEQQYAAMLTAGSSA